MLPEACAYRGEFRPELAEAIDGPTMSRYRRQPDHLGRPALRTGRGAAVTERDLTPADAYQLIGAAAQVIVGQCVAPPTSSAVDAGLPRSVLPLPATCLPLAGRVT
jgi:hypothetical protein